MSGAVALTFQNRGAIHPGMPGMRRPGRRIAGVVGGWCTVEMQPILMPIGTVDGVMRVAA